MVSISLEGEFVQKFRLLFFLCVALYICSITFFGQPSSHSWRDILTLKEVGTLWATLSWRFEGQENYFYPAAIMCHHQGPMQFLFLNFYYFLIGDILPLTPTTTQIPHALLTFLCAILFFTIGRKIHSERFGVLCVLFFLLPPWLPMASRRPWIFEFFSCFFELSVFAVYIHFLETPNLHKGFYRTFPPLLLALYLTGGLDWPAFFLALALFLWLNKSLRSAVMNPYQAIPAGMILAYAVTFLAKFSLNFPGCDRNILLYPFQKIMNSKAADVSTPLLNLLMFMKNTIGVIFLFSLVGAILFLCSLRGRRSKIVSTKHVNSLSRNFFLTMSAWFFLASLPFMKHGSTLDYLYQDVGDFHPYGYVFALPSTFLASLLCVKFKKPSLIGIFLILTGWQWYVIAHDQDTFAYRSDDRRAVAGAAFLLEKRPDLLQQEKRTLLVGDIPRSIGNYARGENSVLSIAVNAPQIVAEKNRVHAPTGILGEFLQSYDTERILFFDWLILSSEVFDAGLDRISFNFYQRLSQDPHIDWFACLQDQHGRKIWLGEVKTEGAAFVNAHVYEVEPFAQIYQQKYNRISFLKRNVRRILHY